ncbi:hypothetical protein [Streptomyces sp. NRRL B-24085]|uniref:hypothetical protein n=1 Tax=Streptomyces sp. NRRL B-24085 TaxID=1709476 RepID=UPI0006B33D14|nr:hypothetical protein [Streptomyces sp. NRRL B-24085]
MSRGRLRILSAIGIGCYALAAIAGFFVLADHQGYALLVPLWIAHGVLLAVLLSRLCADETALSAALLVGASLAAVYVADLARDELTLDRRGERVTATVVRDWPAPDRGRGADTYDYALARRDGTRLPGPALQAASGSLAVGQTVTVLADPAGVLRPRLPGDTGATGEALGVGAFALIALGVVGATARRGALVARRREERARVAEQEHTLREALRTASADDHGFVEVHPAHYPDLPHRRAAGIAGELGMAPADEPGSWRFRR